MDPWEVIGWIILALLALWFVRGALAHAFYFVVGLALHRKTRDTPLATGQEWLQGSRRIVVGEEIKPGRFSMSSETANSRASWTETRESWAKRVRAEGMMLVKR